MRRLLPTLAAGLALGLASPAAAHPARSSAAMLDLGARVVHVELHVPADQLALALGEREPLDAATWSDADAASLRPYLLEHVGLQSPDGAPWAAEIDRVEPDVLDDAPHLTCHLTFTPPPGAPVDRFTFRDDLVLHRVVTHRIYVMVRHDLRHGQIDDTSRMEGVLRYQRTALEIDRTGGSWWRGFAAVFTLGAEHILGGADHLLFLLVLLLPVLLSAAGPRWGAPLGARASARALARVVTAFTLGHSLTLALGATGLLRLPSQPVELLIAASILVSAVHAARPLFPRREGWVAAAFGLVHGLAFASEFSTLWPDPPSLALGLLGFNLGIEAMQLGIVLLVAPSLILLATSRAYAKLRIAGASVAAIGAAAWLLERGLGLPNPVAPLLDAAFERGLWIAGGLGLAAALYALRRRSQASATSAPSTPAHISPPEPT